MCMCLYLNSVIAQPWLSAQMICTGSHVAIIARLRHKSLFLVHMIHISNQLTLGKTTVGVMDNIVCHSAYSASCSF